MATHACVSQVRDEDPHEKVHAFFGGDMMSGPPAPIDPIFWFHHAYFDRIRVSWQVRRACMHACVHVAPTHTARATAAAHARTPRHATRLPRPSVVCDDRKQKIES